MNNKKIVMLILVLGLISTLFLIKVLDNTTNDEKKFKKEYELLNNKSSIKLNIPKHNKIKYISYKDAIKLLNNNETGIIYFGKVDDESSRKIVEKLIDFGIKSNDVNNLYYVEYNNNKIDSKTEQLFYKFKDEMFNSNNNELYMNIPTVVAFSNNRILSVHVGDKNLNNSYKVLFDKITESVCYNGDDSC